MIHQCARFKLEACINLRQVTGWFLIVILFFIQASFDAPTQLQARPYLSPPRCDKVLKNILIPQYWSATIGSAGRLDVWFTISTKFTSQKKHIISLVHCIDFDGWMWFDNESQFGWASYPSAASFSCAARFFPKAPGCRARPRACCGRSWRPWWRLHGAKWPSPSKSRSSQFLWPGFQPSPNSRFMALGFPSIVVFWCCFNQEHDDKSVDFGIFWAIFKGNHVAETSSVSIIWVCHWVVTVYGELSMVAMGYSWVLNYPRPTIEPCKNGYGMGVMFNIILGLEVQPQSFGPFLVLIIHPYLYHSKTYSLGVEWSEIGTGQTWSHRSQLTKASATRLWPTPRAAFAGHALKSWKAPWNCEVAVECGRIPCHLRYENRGQRTTCLDRMGYDPDSIATN